MNEIIFLVIMTLTSTTNNFIFKYHEMPDLKTCYEAIEKSKVVVSNGGDSESSVTLYCDKGKIKNNWEIK